jgi:hypothetical protein
LSELTHDNPQQNIQVDFTDNDCQKIDFTTKIIDEIKLR